MGGVNNHPVPQGMSDWMRLVERRLVTQERREPAFQVMQRLGPGLARFAHQVFDWNTENTWMTGHYWSDVGSLHSPDPTIQWIGLTRVAAEEGGVQELVSIDGTIRKQRPFTFADSGVPFNGAPVARSLSTSPDGGELPTFGEWTDMGGGGSGGGPPTGAAGGSLDGFYPNPSIAAGAVGTPELAANAVNSSKIADGTIQAVDLAPGVLPLLTVQDENVNLSTDVRQIDFHGGGVTAAAAGGEVSVTIPDEVWIGVDQPSDPALELWYDPDAVAPPGPVVGGLGYVYPQAVATSVWTIDHPLTFVPNVTVVDSAGTQIEGDVTYPDADTVVVTFSAPFSGTAYLS